ncbi:hypothetical protein N7535_002924 [Penicillium sp. DV-2018c]|nr:hypothetical protein N7535_002924 [Penicillium sp. DV-2018c]
MKIYQEQRDARKAVTLTDLKFHNLGSTVDPADRTSQTRKLIRIGGKNCRGSEITQFDQLQFPDPTPKFALQPLLDAACIRKLEVRPPMHDW